MIVLSGRCLQLDCNAYNLRVIILKKLYFITIPVLICALILGSTVLKRHDITDVNAIALTDIPTIIVDAGHGGFDGGTTSADGIAEKNINLRISLYLAEYLNLFGYNTVLTRDKDISLENDGLVSIKEKKTSDIHNRMDLMNKTDNAIFVSVHQNHYSVEKYSGLQVFYSPNFSGQSSALAQSIQQFVAEQLQTDNQRQIKKCGTSVYLMYNAVKPAVLVECGFLSNRNEAQLLNTEEYQKKIAFCITVGIQNYINTEE